MQIINLSVYGADFDAGMQSQQQLQIGEFNQIDSLLEFVTEIMLGQKNAFPENGSHNPNSKSSHQIKHSSIKMIAINRATEQAVYCKGVQLPIFFKEDYNKLILKEINPPPPKA